MMRGPKVTMTLYRYAATSDGGGGSTKTWTAMRNIRGSLTTIKADELVRTGKESVHIRYQLWCSKYIGLNISAKDELTLLGTTQRFRVQHVDNILEKGDAFKIDLIRIQ